MKYILKKFGYLHISEICKILENEAHVFDKQKPYNPYKPKSEAWFQQVYQNSNTSYQILRPNLTLKPNLKNNIMLYYNVLFNKTVLNNNYGFNYNYNWNRQGFTNVSFQYNQSTQYGYITPLNFNYTNDNLNISLRNQFIYKKQSIDRKSTRLNSSHT